MSTQGRFAEEFICLERPLIVLNNHMSKLKVSTWLRFVLISCGNRMGCSEQIAADRWFGQTMYTITTTKCHRHHHAHYH